VGEAFEGRRRAARAPTFLADSRADTAGRMLTALDELLSRWRPAAAVVRKLWPVDAALQVVDAAIGAIGSEGAGSEARSAAIAPDRSGSALPEPDRSADRDARTPLSVESMFDGRSVVSFTLVVSALIACGAGLLHRRQGGRPPR
jgi:hypothetical protein